VGLRATRPEDREALVATRDDQFRRFMGDGDPEPRPTFCITIDDVVVGWVDFDRDERTWLTHDQVNVGYGLDPDARGKGFATRAVQLLMHHLSAATDVRVATLLIHPDNEWSLAIPRRCRFEDHGTLGDNGSRLFKRRPPLMTYTDGTVTIRPWRLEDVEAHVAGTDDEQIRWLWPEHRASWEAMSTAQRITHVHGVFENAIAVNETGPKWSFGVHVGDALVGHVDCDLANEHVPHGEANISYTIWPDHRGRGYAAAAARLVTRFVSEHTGAREVHVVVDPANEPSLRVARALGAVTVSTYTDGAGTTMIRHVLDVRRSAMSDLVSQIRPGHYLGTQTDPSEGHPSGSIARVDVTPLPGGTGIRFDYEVLNPEKGRVHHESTMLARTVHGLRLFAAHSHADIVATMTEDEPGYFVAHGDESPFPMAIRLEVPAPGRLVYSWSYGRPGDELQVRDVGDLRLLES
jgi:RimJ/RimL family protein N-acetyltransferase